jgi:hypothetical protein
MDASLHARRVERRNVNSRLSEPKSRHLAALREKPGNPFRANISDVATKAVCTLAIALLLVVLGCSRGAKNTESKDFFMGATQVGQNVQDSLEDVAVAACSTQRRRGNGRATQRKVTTFSSASLSRQLCASALENPAMV